MKKKKKKAKKKKKEPRQIIDQKEWVAFNTSREREREIGQSKCLGSTILSEVAKYCF